MNRADFDGSELWTQLEGTLEALAKDDADLDADDGEKVDRVRFLANRLLSYRNLDPAIFTDDMLRRADWSSIAPQLATAFATDPPDSAQLASAVAVAETQYGEALSYWPPQSPEATTVEHVDYAELVSETLSRIRQSADEAVASADAKQEALSAKVGELEAQIAQLAQQIKDDETRLNTALTENNNAFTTAQSERSTTFDSQVEVLTDAAKERFDATHDSAALVLANMRELQDETEKVGSKVAQGFLAREYGSYANREYIIGGLAYALGFCTIIFAVVSLTRIVDAVTVDEEVSWSFTALRLALTGLFGAASGVALRFGGQAMRRAEKSKRSELELRALTPLLSSMEPATAEAVRKDFISRAFGRSDEGAGQGSQQDSPIVPVDLVQLAETLVREARRQAPRDPS